MFSNHLENFLPISSNLKLLSANPVSLEASQICCLGEGQIKTLFAKECLCKVSLETADQLLRNSADKNVKGRPTDGLTDTYIPTKVC